MALFQTPTERTITSRPFKQLLRYFGYDGSQLSEVGDFAGKELYEVSDYVDKVARPKLVFWSSSGERVERVWLEPAERAVLERLVKHFKVSKLPRPHGRGFGVSSGLFGTPSSPLQGVYLPPTRTSR